MGSTFSKEEKAGAQVVPGDGRSHWWKGFTKDEFEAANILIEARKANPGKVSLFFHSSPCDHWHKSAAHPQLWLVSSGASFPHPVPYNVPGAMTTVINMPFDKRLSVGAELGNFGATDEIVVDMGPGRCKWNGEWGYDRIGSLLWPWLDGSCERVTSLCLYGGGVDESLLHTLRRLGCGPKITRLVIRGQQVLFFVPVTFILFTLTLVLAHVRVCVCRDALCHI